MITLNKETLRNPSLAFTGSDEELQELISVLEFELKAEKSGSGLSAIQVNIPYRVAIVRHEKTQVNLYNAKLISKQQPYTFKGEGCLSLPNEFCDTTRFNVIEVENGDGEIMKFSGFIATVVQHELDHFDGILFVDRKVDDKKN